MRSDTTPLSATSPAPVTDRLAGSRRVQALVFGLYCVIFFGVGVLVRGSAAEILSVTALVLAGTVAFAVRVTTLHDHDRIRRAGSRGASLGLVSLTLLALGLFVVLFVVMDYRVPILAPRPEAARLEPVVGAGPIYRVMNEAIFVAATIAAIAAGPRLVKRPVAIGVIVLCAVLLVSLAFRSRLIDFALIQALAWRWSSISLRDAAATAGRPRRARRLSPVKLAAIGTIAVAGVLALTALRAGSADADLVGSTVIDRVFLLNYRVNFARIYAYTTEFGFLFGQGYLNDVLSVFVPQVESTQQVVTEYFNPSNSRLFTMTPTIYGESYLNFGYLSSMLVFIVIVSFRWVLESVVTWVDRLAPRDIVSVAVVLNLVYYIPRLAVTGGMANAVMIKGLSLVVLLALVKGGQRAVMASRPRAVVR